MDMKQGYAKAREETIRSMVTYIAGQKPEIPAKHGGNRSGEGDREDMERRLDGVVASTLAKASVNDNHQDKAARVVSSRANVGKEADTPDHVRNKNPDIPHISNFEQHLREIDIAINRNISDLNSATSQEVLLGRDDISQVLDVAMLEKEKRIHSSGPNKQSTSKLSSLGLRALFLSPCRNRRKIWACFNLG